MQRTLKIIVVCGVLYNPVISNAQTNPGVLQKRQQTIGRILHEQTRQTWSGSPANIQSAVMKYPVTSLPLLSSPDKTHIPGLSLNTPRVQASLSPSYYTQNLGFFCREEWKLEKATKVPLRLRLGSTDYVNWLEKKPNASHFGQPIPRH